ncbi:MAG: hypothetical protein R3B72_25065 [Polyangiaceae bacterium]
MRAGGLSLRTLLLGSLLSFAGAVGEARADDAAAAQVLFDEARALVQAGDHAAACPKFAESQRLDPQLGTLLNLADCYARIGRHASAWARFVMVAEQARARGDAREEEASRRAAELEARLVRVKLTVERPAPGLTVTRDGELVGEASWGVAVPVDPGPHRFVAEAPGHERWEEDVALTGEGETVEVVVPPLRARETAPADPKPSDEGASGSSTWLVAGIVTGGVGVVGLGVGTAFAVIAKRRDDASLERCLPDDPSRCTPEGVALRDDARQAQTIGIVGLAAGGALAAAGLTMILVDLLAEADAGEVAIRPFLGPLGAGLVGSW